MVMLDSGGDSGASDEELVIAEEEQEWFETTHDEASSSDPTTGFYEPLETIETVEEQWQSGELSDTEALEALNEQDPALGNVGAPENELAEDPPGGATSEGTLAGLGTAGMVLVLAVVAWALSRRG